MILCYNNTEQFINEMENYKIFFHGVDITYKVTGILTKND